MTARKNRQPVELDVNLEDMDDVSAEITQDEIEDEDTEVAPATNRKYMSHAGHDHARKGEAGKAARASCRKAVRAWLNAEAEFLAEEVTDVAV